MTRRNDMLSYAPISVLCLVLSFFYFMLMITLIPPLKSNKNNVPVNVFYPHSDVVNLVVVNVLFLLALISFVRASFANPGTVPGIHPWDPECPASYGASSEFEKALSDKGLINVRGLEKKMDGRARFCRLCGKYKPDRAHHSSNMGHCILEMDHYCPWIRNCVGYFNKKYFFLLVLYGASALIGYCVALGPRFLYACKSMSQVLDFFIVFSWILAAMLGAVVTGFCFFHIWLMCKAYTTIEFCEKRRADDSKRTSQGLPVKELYKSSPYDVGVYKNICHVLGPWYLWLIPTRIGMPSDITAGCVFDVDPNHPMYASLNEKNKSMSSERTGSTASTGKASSDSLLSHQSLSSSSLNDAMQPTDFSPLQPGPESPQNNTGEPTSINERSNLLQG